MGCVVNGPGEAREADLGIAAGRRRGHLFIKGKIVRVVPEDEMVAALVEEAEKLVARRDRGPSGRRRRRGRGRGRGRPPACSSKPRATTPTTAPRRSSSSARRSTRATSLPRPPRSSRPRSAEPTDRPDRAPWTGQLSRRGPRRPGDRRRDRPRPAPGSVPSGLVSRRTVTPAWLSCVSPSAPRARRGARRNPVREASSASSMVDTSTVPATASFERLGEQRRLGLVESGAHRGLEPGQWHRGLGPRVPAHEHGLAGVELAGADLDAHGHALELPVHDPAAERRVGAAVELGPQPGSRQLGGDGGGLVAGTVLVAHHEHHDLHRGEQRWEPQPGVVAVGHDQSAHEPRRRPPRGLPDVVFVRRTRRGTWC